MTNQSAAIARLKRDKRLFVGASDVAPVLGCDAQDIRDAVAEDPVALGFKTIRIKSRVRIPRVEFLRFIGVDAND